LELGQTELGQTELGQTELGQTELGETELGETELGETELCETELDCAGAWNVRAAETGLERLEEVLPKHRLGRTSPFRRVPPRV